MNIFNHKTKIIFGDHAIDYLRSLKLDQEVKSVCIATDPMVGQLGLLKIVTDILDEEHIDWKVFDDIESDPTLDHVENGLSHIIKTKPDTLIAIGGGSVIDAAKAIMYTCLETKKKLVAQHQIIKPDFIAIPTTSGTGSEVTSYAVITDTLNHRKIPLSADEMLPDVAILDAVFTRSVPARITAFTGIDVLTHAVESLVSKRSTIFSEMLASEAIDIVFKHLKQVYDEGTHREGRSRLHLASCMAGMAFNSSGLGAVHAFAHAVGGRFKLPHGLANALFLTHVLRHALEHPQNNISKEKISKLSQKLEIADCASGFIDRIDQLLLSLDIQLGLKHYDIGYDDFIKAIPDIIKQASKDICLQTNPYEMTKEEMIKILLASY